MPDLNPTAGGTPDQAAIEAACETFLHQLVIWQEANDGRPVSRSSAEWELATGLDRDLLALVRQRLRRDGRVSVCAEWCWTYRARCAS